MKAGQTCFWRYAAGLGLIVFLLSPGCSKGKAKEEVLTISGSTTVLPIVTKAAEHYKELHPNVKIMVNSGGSGVGLVSVGRGLADIGMISRGITEQEKKNFPGADFRVHVIGRDAVACALSSELYESGVTALSREQIRGIYTGEIKNWTDVGGPDKEILCIDKESQRGTRHVFMDFLFGDENASAGGADMVTGSNNELQTKIAQSDSAVGMLSVPWMSDDVRAVGIEVEGRVVEPTLENIRNGTYPLSRDLVLATNGEPTGHVKKFIDFVLSPEGQKIVMESGYVPVHW